MDASNAPAAYPSADAMIARADALYRAAGATPPSLQR
jgi:hypothetical protein